ncbi:hypothetical protein FH608_048330 [Nonomuraea phyllanthi]|uniref:Uncharacterized protein n=1 Tax=Nonomuraea phyllanthi TaxID=2219224 RepID=A0A5C4V0E1_9ACTN|nr:hypothetical protein [Nonomuraea phyllanthi]KAB8184303.1 hypothetical protein FH608_048330 [Nonomuraea phyllanthi]
MRVVKALVAVVGYAFSLICVLFSYAIKLESYSAADPGSYNPIDLGSVIGATIAALLAVGFTLAATTAVRRWWALVASAAIILSALGRIALIWYEVLA